jgi:CheY-like chemotaxis protein
VAREVLSQLLASLGHTAHACENGRVAYDLIAAQPQRFAVLITDISMPEVDGVTLINNLHQELGLQIPTIAVTAYSRDLFNHDLIDRFEAWLMKPISRSVLSATLDCLLWGLKK